MATARLRLLGQFQRYSCCHENGDGLASEAYWKNIENDVVFDEIKYRDILYLRSKSGPCMICASHNPKSRKCASHNPKSRKYFPPYIFRPIMDRTYINRTHSLQLLLFLLLLRHLLHLVLNAELVVECFRQPGNDLQLLNGLDAVVKVSILLNDEGRLGANSGKFLDDIMVRNTRGEQSGTH